MDNIEQFYKAWAPNSPEITYLNWRQINVQYFKGGWDWGAIAWKNIERRVFNLQKRIYRATKEGQYSKAYSLIKLLTRSSCNIVLSVRKVTQDNKGSKTPGIDNYRAISPRERVKLTKRLMEESRKRLRGYKAKPLKRIYIPKKNGKQRPLGIPTQYDRVVQNLVKNAIEPSFEAEYAPESYGFRPAQGAHDAVQAIRLKIMYRPKWILDADIKGYFDNIDHKFILNLFEDSEKHIAREWLKSGYIDSKISKETIKTDTGTPQGGIISPLIANKVLDGMQRFLRKALCKHLKIDDPETEVYRKIQNTKVVRYADDFIVINEDKNIIVLVKYLLKEWLKERGVELSEEKTKIVSTVEGFDFLGFHFQHHKGDKAKGNYRIQKVKEGTLNPENKYKLRITPSDKSVKKHKEVLKETIKKAKAWSQKELIENLNRKIMGWANYYRFVDSSQCFSQMQNYLWKLTFRWARRRHGNKSVKWVKNKYFHTTKKSPKGWHFACKYKETISKQLSYYQDSISKLNQNHRYFTMVKEGKSFFDGDTVYWNQRNRSGYGGISPSKAKMLKRQDGRCSLCKGLFKNEDLIETHHIVFIRSGGDNKRSNLTLIHRHCHDQYHAKDTKGQTSPRDKKRSSKLEKIAPKASKTLEVNEYVFLDIEKSIRSRLKAINRAMGMPKLKLGKGNMMFILNETAKHYGGQNPLRTCPDEMWVEQQLKSFYGIRSTLGTRFFKIDPERLMTKWRKLEDDANKGVKGGIDLFSTPQGKAAKAKQLKVTRPQHTLKKSKEVSQNLKIRLLQN